MKIENYIDKFNPCEESKIFLRKFETFLEAWNACNRGDWMLSAARLLGVDLRVLTLAKGLCANTVRHLMKDPRSIAAVDAAIAFGRGEIDCQALDAADACADAAAAVYVARAAYAAVAARAAAAAARAVDAAAADAYAADAYAAAKERNKQQTADICREILTKAVIAALSAAERGE